MAEGAEGVSLHHLSNGRAGSELFCRQQKNPIPVKSCTPKASTVYNSVTKLSELMTTERLNWTVYGATDGVHFLMIWI